MGGRGPITQIIAGPLVKRAQGDGAVLRERAEVVGVSAKCFGGALRPQNHSGGPMAVAWRRPRFTRRGRRQNRPRPERAPTGNSKWPSSGQRYEEKDMEDRDTLEEEILRRRQL